MIYVYQTDNRPTLGYLIQTMKVNMHYSNINKYKYIFEEMKIDNKGAVCLYGEDKGTFHPALYKIMMVNRFLSKDVFGDADILIFLDSDAWIHNPVMLEKLLNSLPSSKQGIFSRDPYTKRNTFINSGSFIIKINQYSKEMYSYLEKEVLKSEDNMGGIYCGNSWPYDQIYISDFVFKNKDDFIIYEPEIINTPIGKIIKHSWFKNFSTCHIQDEHEVFDLNAYIDTEPSS